MSDAAHGALPGRRIGAREVGGELGLRVRRCRARGETANQVERGERRIFRGAQARGGERRPEIGARGELEAGRHDADDRIRDTVELKRDLLADRIRVAAELPPPHTVADDDDGRGTYQIVGRPQCPAECGHHAEDVEVIPGYERATKQRDLVAVDDRNRE